MNHEDSLLNFNVFDFVSENGKWIEPELPEIAEALRMNHAGVAICRQIKWLPIDEQRFLQFGEKDKPTDRWLGGCYQQAVLTAGV